MSAGAAHERVRKLRERGVIRRTTVEVDPDAVGSAVLAYVMVDSTSWMGDSAQDFAALPEILEAHVIAGSASVLVKVRTATTEQLQDVLRRIYAIDGDQPPAAAGGPWSPPGRSTCAPPDADRARAVGRQVVSLVGGAGQCGLD